MINEEKLKLEYDLKHYSDSQGKKYNELISENDSLNFNLSEK